MDRPSPNRPTPSRVVPRLVLIAAMCALALAANHFLLHWVLFTESHLRRFLY